MKPRLTLQTPTTAEEMRAYIERKTVADGDCLVWQARAVHGVHPQMSFRGSTLSARRVIFEFLRGPIQEGRQVGMRRDCHCLCVEPEHMIQRTRSQAIQGHAVSTATRAKIAAKKRAMGKLTPEAVAQIRASEARNQDIADQYGIARSMASRVRNGRAWRDYASPFRGLV